MSSRLELYSLTALTYRDKKRQLLDLMLRLQFNDAARECIDDVAFVQSAPDIHGSRYFFDPSTGEMTSLGLTLFKSDLEKYTER